MPIEQLQPAVLRPEAQRAPQLRLLRAGQQVAVDQHLQGAPMQLCWSGLARNHALAKMPGMQLRIFLPGTC